MSLRLEQLTQILAKVRISSSHEEEILTVAKSLITPLATNEELLTGTSKHAVNLPSEYLTSTTRLYRQTHRESGWITSQGPHRRRLYFGFNAFCVELSEPHRRWMTASIGLIGGYAVDSVVFGDGNVESLKACWAATDVQCVLWEVDVIG